MVVSASAVLWRELRAAHAAKSRTHAQRSSAPAAGTQVRVVAAL
jgi:hypothetical protein